jgi:ABC-2 type transport system permease protein
MKKIFAIAFKDTLVRFASPSEWLFFILLPILFTVILGSATGSASDSRIHLPVVDQAQNAASAELLTELDSSQSVRIQVESLSKAQSAFDSRRESAVLIIPANFSLDSQVTNPAPLKLLQQPNNTDALISAQAVQTAADRLGSLAQIAAQSVAAAEKITPFADETARQTYYAASLTKAQTELGSAPERLTTTQGTTSGQVDYDPRTSSSAGQLITWVFIPLIGLSGTFAYERQKGTLRRLMTTPTHAATYLFATITGQVLTALVQMALLVAFGILVMHVNWAQNLPALAIMLLASALVAAALGTMVGTFVKTESQASGISIMLGMTMALLGGCWYPLELFPQTVRTIVKILPTTWSMEGLLNITMRSGTVSTILPNALVLLGFAVLFFSIGVWRFKYE